jgi:hypothetical protein
MCRVLLYLFSIALESELGFDDVRSEVIITYREVAVFSQDARLTLTSLAGMAPALVMLPKMAVAAARK